jgi:hypothetical protein
MIIALAGVARSSRTAVQPLESMEAQSLDHTNRGNLKLTDGRNSVLSRMTAFSPVSASAHTTTSARPAPPSTAVAREQRIRQPQQVSQYK